MRRRRIAGCHTYWHTRNEAPPPGACESTESVRLFEARIDDRVVSASLVGGDEVDPVYAMQLEAFVEADGITLAVVLPPPDVAEVRLVDSSGHTLDRTVPSGGAVALAGLGSGVAVEAMAAEGDMVAECGPDRVVIDGIGYVCTLARQTPVTTTIAAAPEGRD